MTLGTVPRGTGATTEMKVGNTAGLDPGGDGSAVDLGGDGPPGSDEDEDEDELQHCSRAARLAKVRYLR